MAKHPYDLRQSFPPPVKTPTTGTALSKTRAYPSPQYVPMQRQQSGFPFPRMPVGSTPPAPSAGPTNARASIDGSCSTPNVQITYVRYPSLHRSANRTRIAAQGRQIPQKQAVDLPSEPPTQSLPSGPDSSVPHTRTIAGFPPEGASFGLPISKTTSAPAAIPLRAIAKQRLRLPVKLRPSISHDDPVVDWRKLPLTALSRVLAHVRDLHLEPRSRSCNTCYMRDLDALQRSCKAWASAAQKDL